VNNPDILKAFIKQAVGSAGKAAATDLVAQFADGLSVDELSRLVGILQERLKRKRETISTVGTVR